LQIVSETTPLGAIRCVRRCAILASIYLVPFPIVVAVGRSRQSSAAVSYRLSLQLAENDARTPSVRRQRLVSHEVAAGTFVGGRLVVIAFIINSSSFARSHLFRHAISQTAKRYVFHWRAGPRHISVPWPRSQCGFSREPCVEHGIDRPVVGGATTQTNVKSRCLPLGCQRGETAREPRGRRCRGRTRELRCRRRHRHVWMTANRNGTAHWRQFASRRAAAYCMRRFRSAGPLPTVPVVGDLEPRLE
jgi:hypothetical protein